MNLIQNPKYTGNGEGWHLHASGGGTFTVEGETAVLTIKAPGDNIQFYQPGIALKPATRYRIGFEASSSDASDMSVHLHRNTAPYDSYGLSEWYISLSSETKAHEAFFTTPATLDNLTDGRLRFWFAKYATAGAIYRISNVSLTEAPVTTEPDPPDPPPSVDLSRQLSVIVRDIPPGGRHEVRHVRPSDLVVVDGNIDWTATQYTSFILEGLEDETED